MPPNSPSFLNKRFALIGLPNEEANLVADALAAVHAIAETIADDAMLPGRNALTRYDACIVSASPATANEGVPSPRLDGCRVLVIADEAQLASETFAAPRLEREIIVRPLRKVELLARLSSLMRNAGIQVPFKEVSASHRVLVVDDDETVRTMLSSILEASGFKCDCVPRASEALAALACGIHDLVLLDLGMPEIDGFQVLEAMRRANPVRNPAVIVVSSASREEDVVRGFALGVDDYVTKPFKSRELIARSQRAIRNHEYANMATSSLTAQNPIDRTAS